MVSIGTLELFFASAEFTDVVLRAAFYVAIATAAAAGLVSLAVPRKSETFLPFCQGVALMLLTGVMSGVTSYFCMRLLDAVLFSPLFVIRITTGMISALLLLFSFGVLFVWSSTVFCRRRTP